MEFGTSGDLDKFIAQNFPRETVNVSVVDSLKSIELSALIFRDLVALKSNKIDFSHEL